MISPEQTHHVLPDYFDKFSDSLLNLLAHYEGVLETPVSETFLWILSSIGLICLGYLFYCVYSSIKNRRTTNLTLIFWITWLYGILVYDIGMFTDDNVSLITNLPMAVLYGFKIFLLDSDVSEIHEGFHHNWLYSGNFALVHVLAACVSALFIIKHFGFNIISRLRLWLAGIFGREVNHTYIFWGTNEPSFELIENITRHYRDSVDSESYRIIVVRTPGEETREEGEHLFFFKIMNFIAPSDSDMEHLIRNKCLSTNTSVPIDSLKIDANGCGKNILGEFRLTCLKKLIRKTKNRCHLFFLSGNETENLLGVSLLQHDTTLRNFTDINRMSSVKFYCRARYNSTRRVIEDEQRIENMSVQIIDSAHISVELLKQRPEILPVNFVDVEANASVSSPFFSLVAGYNDLVKDIIRFLYEFGAFVDYGNSDNFAQRSKFRLDVVDKNLGDAAGPFVVNLPDIPIAVPSLDKIFGPADNRVKKDSEPLITLNNVDFNSVEFYEKLKDDIKNLNYVVIASEDDELNMSTGIRILKLAIRYRENLDKFCILIHIHNDETGIFKQIKNHYNMLWKAQMVQPTDKSGVNQKILLRDEADKVEGPLFLFGLENRIYTFENIVDNHFEQMAAEFKEIYTCATEPGYVYKECDREKKYYKQILKNLQLSPDLKDYHPTYKGVSALRRMQHEDLSNFKHIYTKILLKDKASEKLGFGHYNWEKLLRKFQSTDYSLESGEEIPSEIINILNTLAQTEHLRWNASHELLGFIGDENLRTKDEIRLIHGCLTDWDKLTQEIKSYDYNVVDFSLGIINKNRPIRK